MTKDRSYWAELDAIAQQIVFLSQTIQRPLITQYMEEVEPDEIDSDEIMLYCSERYTEEQTNMWVENDKKCDQVSIQYKIDPPELMSDIWTMVNEIHPAPDQQTSIH